MVQGLTYSKRHSDQGECETLDKLKIIKVKIDCSLFKLDIFFLMVSVENEIKIKKK